MGGIIFILFIILPIVAFVGYIFMTIKMSNVKHRAKQHILKDTGISSSKIDAGLKNSMEKKQLEKFLSAHSNFTEESIKNLFKQYADALVNKNEIEEFSQEVREKIQKDSKIDKVKNMEFIRVNIGYYNEPKLNAIAIYTDNKDEYEVFLYGTILNDKIQINRYQISKGAVIGF